MQAPIKLHWFPIEPSWIIAIVIVILAALPHQLPVSLGLRTNIGRIGMLLISIAVGWKKPVLGVALFILLLSTNMSDYIEGFAQNITRDRVNKKGLWYSEEVMHEVPTTIQEKTDSLLVQDHVTEQNAGPWFGESSLGENPQGIQERSSPIHLIQETSYPQSMQR
jgi:hypothetical protein